MQHAKNKLSPGHVKKYFFELKNNWKFTSGCFFIFIMILVSAAVILYNLLPLLSSKYSGFSTMNAIQIWAFSIPLICAIALHFYVSKLSEILKTFIRFIAIFLITIIYFFICFLLYSVIMGTGTTIINLLQTSLFTGILWGLPVFSILGIYFSIVIFFVIKYKKKFSIPYMTFFPFIFSLLLLTLFYFALSSKKLLSDIKQIFSLTYNIISIWVYISLFAYGYSRLYLEKIQNTKKL
ncbi:hypothetical protein KO465_03320 [Candidatus Micrarchaeota archaeon]|nr:hypothetical protein [Candidatus Micrarchaeota archaeon]